MTKRAAILIASPTVKCGSYSATPLYGTKEDIKEWKRFLSMPLGGCWNPDGPNKEIYDMTDCSSDELFRLIEELKNVDYLFFVYSGHGVSSKDDDFIFSKYGQDCISVNEVKSAIGENGKKGVVLINACRNENPYFDSSISFKSPTDKSQPLLVESARDDYRKTWENILNNGKTKGIVSIHSCSKNEESYMYPPSAQYSLFCEMMFHEINKAEYPLTIGNAFKSAQISTGVFARNHIYSGKQSPFCDNDDVDYPLSLGSTLVGAEYLME